MLQVLDSDAPESEFAIVYSTVSAEEVTRLVIRNYGIAGSVQCQFISRGVGDTYRVLTSTAQFAFKIYRHNWRTREAILGELSSLMHLSARGVAVAAPVIRKDGGLITHVHAPEGSRNAVLFHWVPGYAPSYTESAHAECYGRLLAKLHTASDDLPPCPSRPQLDLQYLLEKPLTRIRPVMQSMPSVGKGLEPLVDRLREHLCDADLQSWDWGFCHGDIWADNARIADDRIVLFDFDFCGVGWRLFDLATYRWDMRAQGAGEIGWKPFLDGYLQIRALGIDSLRWVGLFMILRHLWATGHAIRFPAEFGDSPLPQRCLEDVVPFCERIEAEVL